jgi:ABC-type phosphate transport system permease subunit
MESKNYSKFSDQELLEEQKKLKSFSLTNALFIGFLLGVIVFSILKSSWGMLTLIPIYFIYKMVNDPRNKKVKELEKEFKDRNLKNE